MYRCHDSELKSSLSTFSEPKQRNEVSGLLAALDAFLQEDRRCGEMGRRRCCTLWRACECGAQLVRPVHSEQRVGWFIPTLARKLEQAFKLEKVVVSPSCTPTDTLPR